MQQEEAE